jgi:hypothetical protein
MTPSALLITTPAIDFPAFIGASQEVLGYNPAAKVDDSPIVCSDTDRYLACLAELRECALPDPGLLVHVTFSVLAAADDRDMLDILQIASMPFVVADTLRRGIQVAVLTGTLAQWRDAVKAGATRNTSFEIRVFFNRVMSLFGEAGINAWKDLETHPLPDRTLYLK